MMENTKDFPTYTGKAQILRGYWEWEFIDKILTNYFLTVNQTSDFYRESGQTIC